MRRPIKKKNIVEADRVYNSDKLSKFINYVMLDGKRTTAERVVYKTLENITEKTKNPNPLEVFELALKNASPTMEVRSRRVGGANYQVPREVRAERRLQLSMRWITEAARGRKGVSMDSALTEEILAAFNNEGAAIKKRDDTHKMAEANKAFAHFAW
jgi:small subunit ribosomal protein S7